MHRLNIHPIAPVSLQPTTELTHWQIYWVKHPDGVIEHHLVGSADGEGRVSSKVLQVDMAQRKVITRSGRVYSLTGEPGSDLDAQYVWNRWLHLNQTVAGGVAKLADLAGLGN